MIDLNSEQFETKETKPIFNNGQAGEVVCSVKVKKKDSEKPANYPDWELILVDSNNAELSDGFYYLDPNHANYANQLKAQGIALNHLVHTVYGKETSVPVVSSAKELLDTVMNMLARGIAGKQFKFGVTYGTHTRPNKKGFLGRKKFVPFMTADLNEAILFNPKTDLMERIVPDEAITSPTAASIGGTDSSPDDLPWEIK